MFSRPATSRHLRVIGVFLTLAGLVTLPGCWVASIHPLYEDVSPKDPDIVSEKGITGSWSDTDEKCVATLTVTAKDEAYELRFATHGKDCGDGKESRTQARLIKLDTHYFLDVSPMEEDVCDACAPLHWIFLTAFDKDSLTFTSIDSGALRDLLRARAIGLQTVPEDPNSAGFPRPITLTALPKDLKEFFRKFAASKDVFNPQSAVVFRRKESPTP